MRGDEKHSSWLKSPLLSPPPKKEELCKSAFRLLKEHHPYHFFKLALQVDICMDDDIYTAEVLIGFVYLVCFINHAQILKNINLSIELRIR